MSTPNELPRAVQASWHGFLETYEPLRTDLYRYCRHLTRSPWDAEDLSQDALARAFVTLGQLGHAPPSPRAWLFKVASNLWIDRLRRRRREEVSEVAAGVTGGDPRSAREAAGTLIGQLSPQERAAVVLKDVFDLSLEEADCAAAPALFYARQVMPFGERRHLSAYSARLERRPSFARVLEEAKPYLAMFPG